MVVGLGVVFRRLGGGVVGGWYHTPKLGEGGPNLLYPKSLLSSGRSLFRMAEQGKGKRKMA